MASVEVSAVVPVTVVPAPGAHGGDGRRVAEALGLDPAAVLDLSASLNPAAPDPTPVVRRHLDALGRYPDPSRATASLAEHLGVDRRRLLLTNGGAEAITLVGRAVGGRVEEPDFSLYPRGPVRSGLLAEPPRWRSNPHSPSGHLADPEETAGVWDEAFWPLATGTWTRGDHHHGSVVVGSLTKLLSCPGLRLGYLVVPDGDLGDRLLAAVTADQPAWSVGGVAADALPDLLAAVDLPAWSARVRELRTALADGLARRGRQVDVAHGPWVLVRQAGDLRAQLARRGIVVRDCSSFGWSDTIRMAVPDDRDRERVFAALDDTD